MAAGAATLATLKREQAWTRLDELGADLERKLAPVLAAAPIPVGQVRIGSVLWFYFQPGPAPRAAGAIDSAAGKRFAPVFQALLNRGMYVAPSAYEVFFLSLAHTREHVDAFVAAFGDVLAAQERTS
jgi:glutamate-1-semialdehyde 2,1-aminomutase